MPSPMPSGESVDSESEVYITSFSSMVNPLVRPKSSNSRTNLPFFVSLNAMVVAIGGNLLALGVRPAVHGLDLVRLNGAAPLLRVNGSLLPEGPHKQRIPGVHGHVLAAVDRISHGPRANCAAHRSLPQQLPITGVQSKEVAFTAA